MDYLDDAESLDILPMTNHGRSGSHRPCAPGKGLGRHACTVTRVTGCGLHGRARISRPPLPTPPPAHGAQLRSQVRRAQLSGFGGLGVGDDRPRVPRGSPARQVAGSSRRVVIVYWPLALCVSLSANLCQKSIVLSSCIYRRFLFLCESDRNTREPEMVEVAVLETVRHEGALDPKTRGATAAREPRNRRARDGHRHAAGGHHQKARL